MSEPVLILEQAEALAARTLAAINRSRPTVAENARARREVDRERVASDLEGLRASTFAHPDLARQNAHHARRYSDGLRRTAELYEEKP